MPTLTLDLLTSNKMGDQEFSCIIHLTSMVLFWSADTHIHIEWINNLLLQLRRREEVKNSKVANR